MERTDAPGEDRDIPHNPHDGAAIGWPDWRGEIVAIIASGPSANRANIQALRGRAKVIAIKKTIELCPWADAVYGCDPAWWHHRRGLPGFKGLKIAWSGAGIQYPDIKKAEIAKSSKGFVDELLFDKVGTIGGGGNSGFQALNLALQFGARKVLLIGFDMSDANGKHWYGRNTWPGAANPDFSTFKRWLPAFDKMPRVLAAIGAEVVNCSPASALKTFPFQTIEDALQGTHGARSVDMAGV